MEERAQYRIDVVITGTRETLFVLDGYKDGCNKILFRYGTTSELKGILAGLFTAGDVFDFTIKEKPGNEACTIDSIIRPYQGLTISTEEIKALAAAPLEE